MFREPAPFCLHSAPIELVLERSRDAVIHDNKDAGKHEVAHLAGENRMIATLDPVGESKKRGRVLPTEICDARFPSAPCDDFGVPFSDRTKAALTSVQNVGLRVGRRAVTNRLPIP